MNKYLSIDIGASSGRHIVGWYDGDELRTEEVYRFSNGMQTLDGHLVWDIDALGEAVIAGIAQAKSRHPEIVSLAIDTWGVDYVLMQGDHVISPCFAYRDARTEQVIEQVHAILLPGALYARTGIQFQTYNSIYQLYADRLARRLDAATDYLLMPEYLNYLLTGVKIHEYTNATTMGLINAETGEFDQEIIAALGLPAHLFGKVEKPGMIVGSLKPEIAERVGGDIKVILCASHDTASAIAAIPMPDDEVYLSSGTWSLLGIKTDHPDTSEESRLSGYSNEGGVGCICYLKNIMGMWIVNRLREELCPYTPYAIIESKARESKFEELVDVNNQRFFAPDSMKAAFDSSFDCAPPIHSGDYFRCAFRSLAEGYHQALQALEQTTGRQFKQLYIVGGGAKNAYLNDLIRDTCGIEVVALPIEATALGNLLVQANVFEKRN